MNLFIIICALIIGISVFFFLDQFEDVNNNVDEMTAKRLKGIKNKIFLTNSIEKNKKNRFKMILSSSGYRIAFLGSILDKLRFTDKIRKNLKTADIKLPLDIFLLISGGLFSFCFFLGIIFSKYASAFTCIGIILAYIPFIMVKVRIKKRHDLFSQQFPDALGLIASALRAGHSLTSSFSLVVNEMPEPIANVFKVVVDDISLGRDTRDALDNMCSLMPDSVDLRFFITAVLIQREIGGNLAEILDNLGHTIRERFKLIGQLNAQTAQAKLSGIVLALAPVIIGLLIWTMNPAYMSPLFNSLMGQLALVVSFLMGLIGFLIIRQITNIRV